MVQRIIKLHSEDNKIKTVYDPANFLPEGVREKAVGQMDVDEINLINELGWTVISIIGIGFGYDIWMEKEEEEKVKHQEDGSLGY